LLSPPFFKNVANSRLDRAPMARRPGTTETEPSIIAAADGKSTGSKKSVSVDETRSTMGEAPRNSAETVTKAP